MVDMSPYPKERPTAPAPSRHGLEDVQVICRHSVGQDRLTYNPNHVNKKGSYSRPRGRSLKMNNRDPYSLEKENMDAYTVWQWRITHVRKYSGCPEPFHYSSNIGLDFNVETNTQKRLHSQLVTNGVILEVCDFAKTVNHGEKHFISNILENNFNIGLENEQQRIDFTAGILRKVKDLLRNPPGDEREVFTLFDTSHCTSSSGLHKASTEPKTDHFAVEMNDANDSKQEDELKYSQTVSREHEKTESHSDEMYEMQKCKCSGEQSTKELREHVPSVFPYCEEIGLNLSVGAKQSLDPGLLTKGVMLELVHFTRVLTSSYGRIILDVLEHNFDLDLSDQQMKKRVWFQVLHLLKKRKHLTRGGKTTPEFRDEPFSFKTSTFKRPSESAPSNIRAKRSRTEQSKHIERITIIHDSQFSTSGKTEEQTDLDSDRQTDSANAGYLDHLQNPPNSDILTESESCLIPTADISVSSPTLNSNLSFRRKIHEKEQKQSPRNVLHECDMEQEEMGTRNLWKLRANRVEQIVPAINRQFSRFKWFKTFLLEFNIGFRPKQNINVDALADCVFLKIAKFALAMNSSQQDFIMEILEYNFDLSLQSQRHRNIFACEIMNKVRQLRSCDDTVKFSNEVFELPGLIPSSDMGNQSVGSVIPELGSISKMDKDHDDPVFPPHSHAETKECILAKSTDLFTSCKEIGLMLHVNNNQPNKKLDINKLTNAAMMDVTNFAEKLCGTFEQICLDILRHNFDLGLQSYDSELARNILARIPAAMELKNLSRIKDYNKRKYTKQYNATMEKLDCQSVDACSAGSLQTENMDQNGGSSTDIEYKNELNSRLWKLRANHVQRILSIPHEEHCPLYSYSRCKKLGINFNVGSGVKQNLDPKLLTNGIMVEFHTFATAMVAAKEDFVTEILEYNFNLNLKNELYRSAFGHQTMEKIRVMSYHKRSSTLRMNMVFEFPDVNYTPCPIYETTRYCPKCYQDRNHKLNQDAFDAVRVNHPPPHAMTDTMAVDANCTSQMLATDPSFTFPTIEESIMESYPLCKRIGLNLFMDKNHPKEKLDPYVLTFGIMNEVLSFAKKLCGTKKKIIQALLEHNFNIGKQSQDVDLVQMFSNAITLKDGGLAWFSEAFVIRPVSRRLPATGSKLNEAYVMQSSERKEIIKKRKLALQRKQERATLPSHTMSGVKSTYPICTEIGLDLEVTSKSGEKEKLDLNLLTRAVVFEIHKFATLKVGHYYPRIVFDILDCNFDLSSQHYRRWEFSIATASKIQTMVKQYFEKLDRADEVFRLPFLFDPQAAGRLAQRDQIENRVNSTLDSPSNSESSCQGICTPFLTSPDVSSSLSIDSNANPPFGGQPDIIDLCQDEEKIQNPRNVPNVYCAEEEQIGSENYTCPLGESDLDSDEDTDSENSFQHSFENPKYSLNSDLLRESESRFLGDFAHSISPSSEVLHSLPGGNSDEDHPFASQLDGEDLCADKEQTQTPIYAPEHCDMEQEETGTENLWKLRANRVEQILSALNKEFGPFNRSKKVGVEFNVGFGPKQNINVDSLTNAVLLEIAKFVLAINSSQQDFIMEILEYNFDLGLQSQQQRNIFVCEIMNRVRQLSSCEDLVKFSKEVFELPFPMSAMIKANQSEGCVIPELSCISKMEKRDVASMHPSHAASKEHAGISHKSVDLYPCCKEIGLKLHVNSQPRKKLDISKLSNGAMTEVTNFAEKLCGTFQEICVDILRHNLSCDLQSGDSDLVGNTFARIPAAIVERNFSTSVKAYKKIKGLRKDISTLEIMESQNNPDTEACSAGVSKTENMDQNGGSSADVEHIDELNLNLWKLRANHVQRILSIPHEEHCPLYSYSRCKKLGINFNVGSGVKQNLDPKLLTNGIMVEFHTFAVALVSAQKHFVTEILEYNFNLNLKNELYRSAFGHQTMEKFKAAKSNSALQKKMLFELPDLTCIQEPTHDKTIYCPKCYQERNHKLCQDESQPMTDTVSADANCAAQTLAAGPSSALSKIEETIMDSYPRCKKIGLNLCVNIDKPKDKLDKDNLTRGIMQEVVNFARKLCGTKGKIICTLLEHNFNIGKQSREIDLAQMFRRETARKDGGFSWFNEVFVIRPFSRRQPGHDNKPKEASAMQSSERKETIKKRKLALQMKEASAKMPNNCISVAKSKTNRRKKVNRFPFSTNIGLDLDVRSKSGEKDKLDLELLTRAVVFEIHKFANQKVGWSYPNTVFEILDHNFDLSSQHYRRLAFSTATASKIQTMVKRYRLKRDRPYQVFKLPFVFPPRTSRGSAEKRQQKKLRIYSQHKLVREMNESRCVPQVRYQSDGNNISFVSVVKTKEKSLSQIDPFNVEMTGKILSIRRCNPQGNIRIKEEAYDPFYEDMTPERDADEHQPRYRYVATEWDDEHSDQGEPLGSFGCSLTTTCPNFESKIKTESQNEGVHYYMHAEPQKSEGHATPSACTNTESSIKTELDTAEYSEEYCIVTIGEDGESAVIKEEQESELPDSCYDRVVSYS